MFIIISPGNDVFSGKIYYTNCQIKLFFNVKIIDRQARLEIKMQPVSVIFCVVAAATLCHRL